MNSKSKVMLSFSGRRVPAFFCLFLLFAVGWSLRVRAQTAKEKDVEAVLVYNFSQFVEWPASAFTNAGAPFVIGVFASDPFAAVLTEVVRGESVDGHPLRVERYRDLADIKSCHMLFIGVTAQKKLGDVLARVSGQPTLTVSDMDAFVPHGGMIRLFKNGEKKLRVQINMTATRAAGLTVSSKLLRIAEVYDQPGE